MGGVGDELMAARPRVVAALASQFGDLDLAEEGFAAAVEVALGQAQLADPAAFLFVTGKRKILDMQRSAKRAAQREADYAMNDSATDNSAEILPFPDAVPDERLRLLFICCHPAIALEARAMLALRTVLGTEIAAIASGFLMKPDAVRQRITRAKKKIREARLPFEMPAREHWEERFEAMLLALEQAYTAAYREHARPELAEEVERLSLMLAELVPDHGESLGLVALILLTRSREAARSLPLSEQDTSLWDRRRIEAAQRQLDAPFVGGIGRFRLMALIHLTHAQRLYHGITDWKAITTLYDALLKVDSSAVVQVNRALALGQAGDPEAGLAALPREMAGFSPWYAARGTLLHQAGMAGARDALLQALELTAAPGARALIERRLAALSGASYTP